MSADKTTAIIVCTVALVVAAIITAGALDGLAESNAKAACATSGGDIINGWGPRWECRKGGAQ